MENKLKCTEVYCGAETIKDFMSIVSDGTKEGTKVFWEGIEMRNDHWGRLIFEFDFPLEKWTIRVEYLPLADWPSPFDKVE